jgi:phage terminase large subunit
MKTKARYKVANPNLDFLRSELKHQRRSELLALYESNLITYDQFKDLCLVEDIKSGVVLEGSSRAFKTISSIDFILHLCSEVETGSIINIMKETYTSFKTTIYNDIDWRFPQYRLRSPFQGKKEVKSFMLFGNKITLIGADSESAQLGVGCDYLYMNEALAISKDVRNQALQRCRKFWWMDYNPTAAEHDIYTQTIGRADVGFLKTTYKDNYQITPAERTQIESYQPIELCVIAILFGSQDEDERIKYTAIQKALKYNTDLNPIKFPVADVRELARCKINEATGTADKYKWKVYGLGERMAPEGLIFPKVTWIKEFPKDVEQIYWGSDFGYTIDPSTLEKVGIQGNNMFVECRFYEPTPTANDYISLLSKHVTMSDIVWADPSGDNGGRGYISEARRQGYQVYATETYPGSIKYGLSIVKKYNLFLVDCPEMRKEQLGYCRGKAKVNGVMVVTDDPIDANNHIWDGVRMTALSNRL